MFSPRAISRWETGATCPDISALPQIADSMARIETCLERNIYWALEGTDRVEYLKERIADDLKYLLWDIQAYSVHADLDDTDKKNCDEVRVEIENAVKEYFHK
ncbi:MAG: hypothetical protein J6L96_00435 [Clostridia bacterium]|nr:hypothetical protein [Clostridia bacterium]